MSIDPKSRKAVIYAILGIATQMMTDENAEGHEIVFFFAYIVCLRSSTWCWK